MRHISCLTAPSLIIFRALSKRLGHQRDLFLRKYFNFNFPTKVLTIKISKSICITYIKFKDMLNFHTYFYKILIERILKIYCYVIHLHYPLSKKKNKYNFEYKSEKTGYPQFWTTKSKAPALLDSPKMHFPNALLPYDFEKFPSAQNDVYIITPLNNIYKVF